METDQTKPKRRQWRRRIFLRSRALWVTVIAATVYALCGFFLVPYLVGYYLPKTALEKYGVEARIGEIRVNPFIFTFEAHEFRLRDARGIPLAGFDRFHADFELSSLFRWALTFRTISVDTPALHVIVAPDGRLNLSALAPRGTGPQPTPKAGNPIRLLLHNITVTSGEIDIIDQRQSTPATLRIRPLNFTLDEISTLPDRRGPYTLAATTLDGESLQWQGDFTLRPLRSSGSLTFSNVKVASLWEFIRDKVNLDAPAGRIDLRTTYALELSGTEPQLSLEDLTFRLSDLALQRADESRPFFKLDALEIEPATVKLADRAADIGTLRISGIEARLVVDDEGRLNLTDIALPNGGGNLAAKAHPSTSEESAVHRPWRFGIAAVVLENAALDYADNSREPALRSRIDDVAMRFALKATAAPDQAEVRLNDLTAVITKVTAGKPDDAQPLLYLEELRLEGGAFDLVPRVLSFDRIGLNGGGLKLVRDTDGSINLLQLLVPPQSGAIKRRAETARQSSTPLRFEAGLMEVSEFKASLSDRTVRAADPIVDVGPVHISVSKFDGRSPSDFKIKIPVQDGGEISAKGRFDPVERTLVSETRVQNLALVPFQPYLDSVARLTLRSGAVTSSGRLKYGPNLNFDGGVRITGLRVTETDSGEPFLSWEVLDAPRLKLHTAPNRLDIEEVKLLKPFNKLIIFEDGSLNLARMIKTPVEARGDAADPPREASDRAAFPLRIKRVRVLEGKLNFADLSLVPQFATLIHDMDGAVVGISSAAKDRAQIELTGRVDEYGTAKIGGEINANDPEAFTDIRMAFNNLEMANLTPYSAKFAGRRIESGKLNLNLEYTIQNRQLIGNNEIVVDRLKLGDKVESPGAVNLPLDLAVALLEDSRGIIDIGLPVRGDLDNPEFSIGHLIWKALVNLLTKIVTSPFNALAGMVNSDAENLDAVAFEPGSAEVPPPEREKLTMLVEALENRPNLRLVVQGRYVPDVDGERLKSLYIRRTLAERTGRGLAPDEDPGPVDFGDPEIRRVLEDMYAQRFGTEKPAARRPPPSETRRSGEPSQIPAQSPSDPALFYKSIYGKLVESEPLPEAVLAQLADQRAEAIVAEVSFDGGLPPERVVIRPSEALETGAPVSAKLTLAVRDK
jgi:uncharacterized protein involved in outer membrane biogenesis